MYCLVTPLKALSFLISTPRSSIPIFVPFSHHRTFFLPAQSQIPCLRIIVEQSWKPPRWFYSNNLTLQKETESERYSLILPRFPPPPPPPLSHKATTCCCCCCIVTSVVSDSVQPHRRQPMRLPHPWDSPGKNTGVGCHFLLQYPLPSSAQYPKWWRATRGEKKYPHIVSHSMILSLFQQKQNKVKQTIAKTPWNRCGSRSCTESKRKWEPVEHRNSP